jgi:hypothetical protein
MDTGLSRGVDESKGAILRIQPEANKAEALCANGTVTPLWDLTAHADVGRAAPCK